MKGKAFGSQTKKLAKRVGGSLKETSAAIPSSTQRKNPQEQKFAGQRLVYNTKDMVIPAEATWSAQFDTKRAWGTSIKKQPGGAASKRQAT
jgi:hypothetical protein